MAKKGGGPVHRLYLRRADDFFRVYDRQARLAKKEGILNVYHSNGFISPEP